MGKTKLSHPHDDIRELFESVLDQSNLTNYINVTILAKNTLKKVTHVKKPTEEECFKTNDDLNILVNELIFEQLTPEQQVMVAEDTIAGYHYDTEKDKLVYTAPDFIAHSGLLAKYGYDKVNVLRESIKSLAEAKAQQEDESKALTGK